MLWLKSITKNYDAGATKVHALRGVDLGFRDCELVAILGPSGCGKTTLLNIIGGLDRYSDGDLIINGRSTKEYKDSDWDSYRNHSIGFVFQTYNLIPHQTVLANVEIALTLSGVGRAERRKRAVDALKAVGLGDQLHKKPNQMSGGQMQRVAIARALVNNPDILLADEPTGALDTETSVQVMDILREVARDRLVIMVTHNPDLAEEYATRTVRLLDGNIISDTMPVDESELAAEVERERAKTAEQKKKEKSKKTSMSFLTAMSLSLNNLMTKKARTLLTSFAGSIGIIGIALILALSTGINAFITQVQEYTLSTYPLTIQKHTQDMSALLSAMTNASSGEDYSESDMIHVDDSLGTMMGAMSSTVENNIEKFKEHIDSNYDDIKDYVSDIQYIYDYNLQVYNSDGTVKVGMETVFEHMGEAFSSMSDLMEMGGGVNVFSQMINNQDILDQQYDVIAGNWPSSTAADEVVLVVNSNNQISKMTLYMLGVLDPNSIDQEMKDLINGTYESKEIEPFTYDYFLNYKFKLLTTADFFEKTSKTYPVNGKDYSVWTDIRESFDYDQEKFVTENGVDVKIVGIVRPKDGAAATSIAGAIGYTNALTDYILAKNASSEVINQQKETPEINVLTGLTFERTQYTPENIGELIDKIDAATMETFYAYMTEQILTNEEFSSRLDVKDKESFSQIFFLMPEANQAALIEKMLQNANESNTMGVTMLCGVLSSMLQNVSVDANNIMTLLPIFGMEELYVLIAGVPASEQMPMTISGLIDLSGEEKMTAIYAETSEMLETMTVNADIFKAILSTMKVDDPAFVQLEETLYGMAPQIDATYDSVLKTLDDAEKASPSAINFYAKDFESKDAIESFIKSYNDAQEDEQDKLKYTDIVGALMSSVTIIVNAISYVLIAFVSISLVVSSVMIGVITNISVLERTKEIGILRSVGASKRDISRVFNAETLIIGLAAGAIGIGLTVILCFPITAIVQYLTGLDNIRAILPVAAGFWLVVVSMVLTLVAGIIPSRSAAKKDPVIALRTE